VFFSLTLILVNMQFGVNNVFNPDKTWMIIILIH